MTAERKKRRGERALSARSGRAAVLGFKWPEQLAELNKGGVHAAAQSGCAPGWPCRRFLGTATADFTEFGANPGGAKTGLDVAVAQQFFNIKRFFSLYCIQSGHSRSSRVDSHLLRW